MKYYIDAAPGSEEFRKTFAAIRGSFLARLEASSAQLNACQFRACDGDGEPFEWVWDSDAFKNVGTVGTLHDALAFAGNMFNQGMCVAFASCSQDGVDTVWLTTWEAPEEGPVWPTGIEVIDTEIHEGIRLGQPPLR